MLREKASTLAYSARVIIWESGSLITLKQKAENVEQEENACAVQVREESFIVHDRQLMGGDIADDVRYADDDQEQRIHKRRHDEQRCSGGGERG